MTLREKLKALREKAAAAAAKAREIRTSLDGKDWPKEKEAEFNAFVEEAGKAVEEMQAVDTKGIAPMSHAQDVSQRLREDVVTETDQRELFQSIAPQVEAGLYLVPKVIE